MPPARGTGGTAGEEQLVLTPDSNREGPPMIIPGIGAPGGRRGRLWDLGGGGALFY
jgi:hypothetical protein